MEKQAISTVSDGFSNLELGLEQDMEEKPSIELSNEKLAFPSRTKALRAARSLRECSQRDEIKVEIAGVEKAIEEAEEDEAHSENDEEMMCTSLVIDSLRA